MNTYQHRIIMALTSKRQITFPKTLSAYEESVQSAQRREKRSSDQSIPKKECDRFLDAKAVRSNVLSLSLAYLGENTCLKYPYNKGGELIQDYAAHLLEKPLCDTFFIRINTRKCSHLGVMLSKKY